MKQKKLNSFPLKGVFEPDYFKIPQVDRAILDFMRHIVMSLADFLSITMFVFFHHPTVVDGERVFFRWFSWRLDINKELIDLFEKAIPKEKIAINLKESKNTLGTEFLQKLSKKLETEDYINIKKLDGFKLKDNKGLMCINRIPRGDFWLIHEPDKFELFYETLYKTAWTVYYPLFLSDRLIGLFIVDGIDREIGKSLNKKNNKFRLQLEAIHNLVNITIHGVFKSYYSCLEDPPSGVQLGGFFFKRNDEGLVFSPVFLTELRNLFLKMMFEIKNRKRRQFYNPLICQFVSYWDVNGIKEINDRLSSHATGNEVIRTMSRWIYDSFREIITKSNLNPKPKFWVIRWGGDEFIVVLASEKKLLQNERDCINSLLRDKLDNFIHDNIEPLIEELCQWKDALCIKGSNNEMKEILKRIGISGGWSWCTDGKKFDEARNQAERAMYVSKSLFKGPLSGRYGCIALEFNQDIANYGNFLTRIIDSDKIPKRLKL